MQILIVYYSQGGHTRKVTELVQARLASQGHDVLVRNALTATVEQVKWAEILLIGTAVHGYILFGQKPSPEVRAFLDTSLPEDLERIPVIGFATYLFFPSKALKAVRTAVESRMGRIIALLAKRRTQKARLADEIVHSVEECVKLVSGETG